jgi:hypothetical protein
MYFKYNWNPIYRLSADILLSIYYFNSHYKLQMAAHKRDYDKQQNKQSRNTRGTVPVCIVNAGTIYDTIRLFVSSLVFWPPPPPQNFIYSPVCRLLHSNVSVCLLDSVIRGMDLCKDLVPPLSAVCKSCCQHFQSVFPFTDNYIPLLLPPYLCNKHNRLTKRQHSTIKFHTSVHRTLQFPQCNRSFWQLFHILLLFEGKKRKYRASVVAPARSQWPIFWATPKES